MKTTLLITTIFFMTIKHSFGDATVKKKRDFITQSAIDLLPTDGELDKFLTHPLKFDLTQSLHNSIEKPVSEPQEPIPLQANGPAIIPRRPPPATPINAVASNVPSQGGAVFLGSGALGVVDLGNGAYALGSGSLGYSMMRAQPRSSIMAPLYPPLPAAPNLIPAAVPSLQPIQPPSPVASYPISSKNFDFGHPLLNIPSNRATNPYGYEPVNPNNVAFGQPSNRQRPIKIRTSYATFGLQLAPNKNFPDPNAAVFQYEFPVKTSTTHWR